VSDVDCNFPPWSIAALVLYVYGSLVIALIPAVVGMASGLVARGLVWSAGIALLALFTSRGELPLGGNRTLMLPVELTVPIAYLLTIVLVIVATRRLRARARAARAGP
jgi:hypothetical protein